MKNKTGKTDKAGKTNRTGRTNKTGKTGNIKRKRKRNLFGQILKVFFAWILLVVLMAGAAGSYVLYRVIQDAPQVTLDDLKPGRFATVIYAADGSPIQTLVAEGANREAAVYDEIPENLVNAFVAIEDSRFWKHQGVDFRSIGRAAVGLISGDYSGGGSTITQQLIKNNIFAGGLENNWKDRIERKLQEQYLAFTLEKNSGLSKEETKKYIMTNYLNTINLGSNSLGVKVASRRYFGKEVSELTLSECAVIASITQNPSRLNPITGAEANGARREIVLEYMEQQGYITDAEHQEALADPVYERIQEQDILRQDTQEPYSYFVDALISQVTEVLEAERGLTAQEVQTLLYTGGLQIYATQDPALQAIVDQEVNNPDNYEAEKYSVQYRLSIRKPDGSLEHVSETQLLAYRRDTLGDGDFDGLYETREEAEAEVERYKQWLMEEQDQVEAERLELVLQPQTSFVLMDHHTGQVKAVNGGRGTKTGSLTLNRATDSLRQPGSAFKVLTSFAPAIDRQGDTLASVYYDAPYTVNGKSFRNWWGDSRGYVGYSNIRDGIIYSMNIVAVRTMMETVTPQLGVEYARNLGISTLTDQDLNAATALGGITYGVSNLEMTAAYAAIANGGAYNSPRFFTRILDREGNVLVEDTEEPIQVLKDSTAFLLTDAMEDSMQANRLFARSGVSINSTSTRAALDHMSAAGKSGTTTNNVDIWFVGFTPYYTAGIWGGCDENQSLRSGNTNNGGTNYHKNIWKAIMDRVHEGLEDPGFQPPDSVETAQICRKSGKLAVPGVCDHDPRRSTVYTEYFAKGTVPDVYCDTHVKVSFCTESGQEATEYCPDVTDGIYMILPEGEESAVTDDSYFARPQLELCQIHAVDTDPDIFPYDGPSLDPDDDLPQFYGPGSQTRPQLQGPGAGTTGGTGSGSSPTGGSSGGSTGSAPGSSSGNSGSGSASETGNGSGTGNESGTGTGQAPGSSSGNGIGSGSGTGAGFAPGSGNGGSTSNGPSVSSNPSASNPSASAPTISAPTVSAPTTSAPPTSAPPTAGGPSGTGEAPTSGPVSRPGSR